MLNDANITHRIIFIDDGSGDKTYSEIEKLSQCNDNVLGISFSRSFGKESAIYAGLCQANEIGADCAVVIDCDLQHPPEKIIEMYKLWQEGFDVIEGVKVSRGKESAIHTFFAKMFYSMISEATKIDM